MRHDGFADLFGPAALGEDFVAAVGMVFQRGPAVVVEIVDEADDRPFFFVLAELAGVGAHAGLDGERVFTQIFRLGELS